MEPTLIGLYIACELIFNVTAPSFPIDAEIFAFWKSYVRGSKWAKVLANNAISTWVDSVVFITLVSIPMIHLVKSRREAKASSSLI